MAVATLYSNIGEKISDSYELPNELFGIKEPNKTAIYEVVKAILANRRQGTAATKTRGMVSGGGKKPFRQKGTGNARRGSDRSPVLVGGGTVFGPSPRTYKKKVNKKVRALALKSALTLKAGNTNVIEDISLDTHKTKAFFNILKKAELHEKKMLIVTDGKDDNVKLAARNIPNVVLMRADMINTYEVVKAKELLFTKGALEVLKEVYND